MNKNNRIYNEKYYEEWIEKLRNKLNSDAKRQLRKIKYIISRTYKKSEMTPEMQKEFDIFQSIWLNNIKKAQRKLKLKKLFPELIKNKK